MTKAFFITGTDTDVGKTTIACGLLAKANQQSLSSAGVKPVASGCEQTVEGLRNSDALLLLENTSLSLTYPDINPIAFEPAIAPHIAAKEAGVELSVASLLPAIERVLAKKADLTLVEGAGGWHVPLNDQQCLSDLASAINLPVILVIGIRLGCVNHALLTVEAIEKKGLVLAGWVANIIDPHTSRLDENLRTLEARLKAPCLGVVPYLAEPTAQAIAHYLSINTLLGVAL